MDKPRPRRRAAVDPRALARSDRTLTRHSPRRPPPRSSAKAVRATGLNKSASPAFRCAAIVARSSPSLVAPLERTAGHHRSFAAPAGNRARPRPDDLPPSLSLGSLSSYVTAPRPRPPRTSSRSAARRRRRTRSRSRRSPPSVRRSRRLPRRASPSRSSGSRSGSSSSAWKPRSRARSKSIVGTVFGLRMREGCETMWWWVWSRRGRDAGERRGRG